MSAAAVQWAFARDKGLTPSARLVLVAIADAIRDEGETSAQLPQAVLASRCCMSVDSVQRRLKELAALGYVRTFRCRPADGNPAVNRYALAMRGAGEASEVEGWA